MVAELAKMFEDHLAEEIGRVRSPTVVVIPVGRDDLLPGLIEGRGDVVMGNLTITPARQKLVDFGPPLHPNVDELVITGPAAKNTGSFDDLVKTGLYVRRSSSYFEHLQALNAERKTQGKKPIPVTEADENLEELRSAGHGQCWSDQSYRRRQPQGNLLGTGFRQDKGAP